MEPILANSQTSLTGLVLFVAYFVTAIVLLLIFMKIYTMLTPFDDVALIKANNVSASVVFVGAMLGFGAPIASAAANSISLLDFAIWAGIAGIVQILTFLAFRKFYPLVSDRIEKGEIAVAIKLGGLSVTVGLINAACITY
ncbi:MAG: DUF350 domain-containing protein [Stappiaceae bacterium]